MIHTVARGETLSLIARKYGILDWRALYEHPQNASFRAFRPDPDLILPGDRIVIPQALRGGADAGPAAGVCVAEPAAAPDVLQSEPIALSARDVQSGAPLPERFVQFMATVLGVRRHQLNKALDDKGKLATVLDGAQGIAELYGCYRAYRKGQYLDGTVDLFTGTANLWNVMPPAWRQPAARSMGRIIGRIPKLRPLGDLVPRLDRIDAYPEVAQLFGALLKGDGREASSAAGLFCEKLRDNPGEAIALCPRLVEFMGGLIPGRMKAKIMAKAAGRKVPILGTIVVGITDVFQIASKPSDWTSWAGLGSTLAGLVPVAGTALSVVLDVGIVIGTVIEHIDDLDVRILSNPVPDGA